MGCVDRSWRHSWSVQAESAGGPQSQTDNSPPPAHYALPDIFLFYLTITTQCPGGNTEGHARGEYARYPTQVDFEWPVTVITNGQLHVIWYEWSPPAQRSTASGTVFGGVCLWLSVCLSVCLFACQHNYSRTVKDIITTFSVHHPRVERESKFEMAI